MTKYDTISLNMSIDTNTLKKQVYSMYMNDDYQIINKNPSKDVYYLFDKAKLDVEAVKIITFHDLITQNSNGGYTLKATSIVFGGKLYLYNYHVYDPSGIALAIYDFKLSEKSIDGGIL